MRRPFAFAAVVAGFLAATVGPAGAQNPPEAVGWWSSDPTAQSEPEGGFQVAAALGRPTSVAALRFSTPSGTTSATLTLTETGGFVTDTSAVQVCVTTEPWQPANPGAMDDAPMPDCASPVPLARDGTTWTAQVAPLLPSIGGERSLMIVPGGESEGGAPVDPGFRVSFADATLTVVAAPGTTTSSTSTTLYTAPPPSGSGSSSSGGGSFTPPRAVTPPAATTPVTQPASAPAATGDAFQPPDLAAGATPGDDGGGADQPWERLLFLVPISAALGVGAVQLRKQLAARGVVEA